MKTTKCNVNILDFIFKKNYVILSIKEITVLIEILDLVSQ